MSIKDLFDKGHSLKFVKNKTRDDIREDLESTRFIESYSEKRTRLIPDTDFTTASNFSRFGLAEEYYDTAIKRIYQTYPYDGSLAEKTEWENQSTYLDLFLFENEYPRTNGFVTFNSSSQTYTSNVTSSIYSSSAPQYIIFYGGPNADSNGDYKSDFSAGSAKKGVSKANIYHTGSHRTNNLELDLEKGVTVEFWLKKDGWVHESTAKHEYFFHNHSTGSEGDSYGSMEIYSYGTSGNSGSVYLQIQSGSTKLSFAHDTGLDNIADSKWHHYSLTTKTSGSSTVANLYVDGHHKSFLESATTINAITGTFVAAIGALAGHVTASHTLASKVFANAGWGNVVSSSFDEFRYWKTERDAQQVGRYYRAPVNGGTNTDNIKYDDISNKVDLGVYYKFNEGITGVSATDTTVLDYSGRISNGTFINYDASESRNTGSAIINAGAASTEFKDPIIYSTHPEVSSLASEKQNIGSAHDHENPSSLYKSMPGWILEEDEEKSNNLKYLTQILASYFDDLYLQIERLSKLKDINYPDDFNYERPLPFAERLLSSRGFEVPELFSDAHALAKYLERDEKKLFEKKLYEIKNTIYQNIYNNLSYIQKSKGTYKSLRNFLRCFGVDEELIKLNVYANNDVYEFKDNHTNTSIRKKYIDFDDLETRRTAASSSTNAYTATAYQYYDVNDSNSISYIPAISETLMSGAMMTIETEVIFPKRSIVGDDNYKSFPSLSSSIFGLYPVVASNTDMDRAEPDDISFNVYAKKPDDDLRNVKFFLTGSHAYSTDLENSNSFPAVYNNEKWNLAFRIRPTKMPTDGTHMIDTIDDYYTPAASAYTYELYGVNYLSNVLRDEFTLSGTMSFTDAAKFFSNPKRIYVGAQRAGFTGSIEAYSDVKISSTRVWMDYLPNEAIRAHAKDPNSYGALNPYRNTNESYDSNFVPSIKSLILNWTMDNLTGSNSSGRFLIEDFASGSVDESHKFGPDWARPISAYNYSGRGDFFTTNTLFLDQAIDVEFVPSAKQKLPEVVNSDDMIQILNKQDDVVFTRDTTYVQHLLSVEKSMYQIISEEMMRFFAGVKEFNNIVGEPVNRYRPHYKKLEKIRELFFLNVENDSMELEKFIEYFKWIDDAISIMIAQLIPVSSNSVELLRNMVESHILERNKYWTKFPTLDTKPHSPGSSLYAIEELKYNWKFGHAPVNPEQNTNQGTNCLWWKQRAERDGVLATGIAKVDEHRSTLLKIAVTETSGSEAILKDGATKYPESYYPLRSLGRAIDLTSNRSRNFKGGGNSTDNKKVDFYKPIIKWGSDDDFLFLDLDNELKQTNCDDNWENEPHATNKKQFKMTALTMPAHQTSYSNAMGTEFLSGNAEENDLRYTDAKSSLLIPFSIYTASVAPVGGYRDLYSQQFGIDITNLHEDKYGESPEIPLQGPFTEKHVGGHGHRHVKLNRGSDTPLTRPEGWHLQEFLNKSIIETIIFESFENAPSSPGTTNVGVLNLPSGSVWRDPSPYEYWQNGIGADNMWTFISGPSPSAGTGPASGKYAYCEVLPAKVGQTFGMITPLIDLLDLDPESGVMLEFHYHMHGIHIGNLKVQASADPTFQSGVEDLMIYLSDGSNVFSIAGQQHPSPSNDFSVARIASNAYGGGLNNWVGRRFYIRFLYTAGIGHLGDCAIDGVHFYEIPDQINRNSFKLFHPTHNNIHKPTAMYTRDTLAKRPVNIRNIHTTGSSPTVAGNYLNKYEYFNTVSPEANDPWFVKNVDRLTENHKLRYAAGNIEDLLKQNPVYVNLQTRNKSTHPEYELLDRSYLTGTVRNRTRIRTRFSSPGGFQTLSRGMLDPEHEIFSPNNVMTFRNLWPRNVHNTQMQAHMGQFGASAHTPTVARVYGDEAAGVIDDGDYYIVSASAHRVPRNTLQRIMLSSPMSYPGLIDTPHDFLDMPIVTASVHDNAFVSHMIPRTDNQTRWITGSLI